ncbi:MAG: hypothetical protein H0T46_36695 [Deltaproteobacteria bacterium]|nr:hypothetical protein [Deltaproteobacteria bacterium]
MRWGLAILFLAACGDDGGSSAIDAATPIDMGVSIDAPVDANPNMPSTLADTGLCTNAACTTYAADVRVYAPQYELWSDGATKKRWIYLPPGTKIDTTDMNYWKFPVGTKLWKEFTRGGVRVETRFMLKVMENDATPGAWFFASYVWNTAQNATTEATPGGMQDANGTQHDIPMRAQCRRCHDNTPGRVLGVQALSLDFQGATGELDLDDLAAMNLLTTNPPGTAGAPRFPLPVNNGNGAVDKAAYGYMHGNCGGCHNPNSSIFATTTLDLRMDVTKLSSVTVMPARVTTVNVNGTVGGLTGPIVKPNDTANSVLITRMNIAAGTNGRMPEIGTEITDPAGLAALTAWINQPP